MLNLKAIFEKMVPPTGMDENTVLVPAENAHGYRFQYPAYIPLAKPVEKADFSRGPQMAWWLDEKRNPQTSGNVHG